MNRRDIKESLETIEHAERAIVLSWSNDRGDNLMEALSDLGVLRSMIERAERESPDGNGSVSELAAALASKSRPQ